MDELQKHYSNLKQTYPQWHDNEVLINQDTSISSSMFEENDKIYIIDTFINPMPRTTFLVGNNCVLKFTRNGRFGNNCVIDCETPLEIEAGMHKIFGTGTIKALLKNPILYPEWWGAVGDGITDDAPAINSCIKAAHRNTVFLGQSFYRIKSTPIRIVEAETETSRYEAFGLSYPTGASETFWEYNGASGPQDLRRKIIINGNLIGDESLVGPVVYVVSFSVGVLEINGTIYVRNTSDSSIGFLQIGTLNANRIHIHNVVKEDNDRTGGATINHMGKGCGIVFGQIFNKNLITIGSVSGFEYGVVITDRVMLSTLCPDFDPIQGSNGKAAGLANKIDIRSLNNNYYPVYIHLKQSNSYFNSNTLHIGIMGQLDTMLDTTKLKDGITVDNRTGNSFSENKITLDATDGYFNHVFNIYRMRGGSITTHVNTNDIYIGSTTDANKITAHLNDAKSKVFQFTNCHNVHMYCIDKLFGETLSFSKCSNIQIDMVRFTETKTTGVSLISDPEVYYGITFRDKVVFDAEISVEDDAHILHNGVSSNATNALILTPHQRYLSNIHYVNTLPEPLTTTNHQFYALTSTEYGTNIKLYKLYDSLGRQVGYVYKDRYTTVQ